MKKVAILSMILAGLMIGGWASIASATHETFGIGARPACTTAGVFPLSTTGCTFVDNRAQQGFNPTSLLVNEQTFLDGQTCTDVATGATLTDPVGLGTADCKVFSGQLGGTSTDNMFGKIVDFDGAVAGIQADQGQNLWNPLLQGQTIPDLQATANTIGGCPGLFAFCNTASGFSIDPSVTILPIAGFSLTFANRFEFAPVGTPTATCNAGVGTAGSACLVNTAGGPGFTKTESITGAMGPVEDPGCNIVTLIGCGDDPQIFSAATRFVFAEPAGAAVATGLKTDATGLTGLPVGIAQNIDQGTFDQSFGTVSPFSAFTFTRNTDPVFPQASYPSGRSQSANSGVTGSGFFVTFPGQPLAGVTDVVTVDASGALDPRVGRCFPGTADTNGVGACPLP